MGQPEFEQDPQFVWLTKCVYCMAVLTGVVGVAVNARDLFDEPEPHMIYGAIMGMGLALLVPFCGFFGTKLKSASLMGCFCGCSLCSTFFALSFLGATVALMRYARIVVEHCDPASPNSDKCPSDWHKASCPTLSEKACFTQLHDIDRHAWLVIVTFSLLFLMDCMSFVFGAQLWSLLMKGPVVVQAQPQFATQDVAAQPPQSQYGSV
mmetsp:Transcript_1472/g.3462  ORF Transcript_1472/g.3462 Transcript_1472/m.3462 type:complete len:208 (+) Transcript_1472:2315-2938(+)